MTRNPILDELHAARRKLLADYQGDTAAYLKDAQARLEASGRPIWQGKQRTIKALTSRGTSRSSTTNNRGVTIVELLVVLGVISILLALLLPGIQSVRESGRQIVCKNNLRQTSLALQQFHDSNKRIPSLYNGTFSHHGTVFEFPQRYWDEMHFHSWRTAILPQLEQSSLYDRIDLTRAATNPLNQPNVNVELAVFQCPSTSNYTPFSDVRKYEPNDVIGTAARSDYEAVGGVKMTSTSDENRMLTGSTIALGAWGLPRQTIPKDGTYDGLQAIRFRDITDGLSNSMVVAEVSGRPDLYVRSEPDKPRGVGSTSIMNPSWAISGSYHGIVLRKSVGVNQSNSGGIYSFHPAGVHVALADGSVRMLSNSTDRTALHALATRAGRESVVLE